MLIEILRSRGRYSLAVIVMINKLISLQINNNSVSNFSSLHKNIVNVTKYIITNDKYQIMKVKYNE